VLTKC